MIVTFWLRRKRFKLWASYIIMTIFTYMVISKARSSIVNEEDLDYSMNLYVTDRREQEVHGVLTPSESHKKTLGGKFAYVTLMCDASWLPQMRALVYSWKRSKSPFPMIVMALPWALDSTDDLVALGAEIKRVDYIDVPFRRANGKRIAFDKSCRYSKIHAWSLTDFEKAVYLDPSLLIVQNIDEIFHYSDFSAVKVAGDEFNTGIFVMKPCEKTFTEMLRTYEGSPPEFRGEEGFLNWFFSNRSTHVISARYNTVIRLKVQ